MIHNELYFKMIKNNLIISIPNFSEYIDNREKFIKVRNQLQMLLFHRILQKKDFIPNKIHVFFQFPLIEEDNPSCLNFLDFHMTDLQEITDLFINFNMKQEKIKVVFHYLKVKDDDYYDWEYLFFGDHDRKYYDMISIDNKRKTIFSYGEQTDMKFIVKLQIKKCNVVANIFNTSIKYGSV